MAIPTNEDGWEPSFDALNPAPRHLIGTPNWDETCLVFDNRANFHATMRLDVLACDLRIVITPFDADMAEVARPARRKYGRASKHRARLNYGDCMAYTLAGQSNEPLPFKGNDFIHTDITPALA